MYVDKSIIIDAIDKVIAHYEECLRDEPDNESSLRADKEDYNILKLKMQATMSSEAESAYNFWRGMDTSPRETLLDLYDLTAEEIAHCCVYFDMLPAPVETSTKRGQDVLKYIKDNNLVKDNGNHNVLNNIVELDGKLVRNMDFISV